ncbi:glycosyltransferase [Photobacterium damselae subsp. damselae]|uniref:Glycosyltransferase n=1 Tax=Photobacterium damselae subsp. damselae TaxID=85581 RepID=A0A850QU96_PHODD|nr:glycosyltransferase [Photobacterium damselae subsp. damselae]
MKNKICFITTGLGMGGAERQVCDLSDELYKLNNEVIVISLTGKATVKPYCSSIQVIELNMKKSLFGLIKALRACRSIIKNFNPDVIHSHMFHANIFTRILRIFTKMPILVCTAHSTNEGGKGRMLAYRYTNFLSDINTNVSNEAVEAFINVGAMKPKQMIAVSNGLNDKRFIFSEQVRIEKRQQLGILDNTFLYLAIGRLDDPKDYPNMLTAMEIVSREAINFGKKVKLVIIGQGHLELKLKQLTKDLGLNDSVTFLGMQRDVECWLSAADCFVLSSKHEGFGLVVAEALLTERLVVATDCGGVKEVLGECGYLVPPNDFGKLAHSMLKALNISKEENTFLVRKGRDKTIENYSIRSIAKRWLQIYQSQQ